MIAQEYNETYTDVKDALNDIDSFQNKLDMFTAKHGQVYKCDIKIDKVLDEEQKWSLKLKLIKNEQDN